MSKNNIMTAEMFDRLCAGAGTANDQIAAVNEIKIMRAALQDISSIPTTNASSMVKDAVEACRRALHN